MRAASIIQSRKDAEEFFQSGLYCAESVVLAIAKSLGIESELLPKIATGFCSGMSRICGTCGALTGGILGINLAYGRSKPDESVEPAYSATQKLIKEFEKEFGSNNCFTLLGGCDLNTPEGQATFAEKGLIAECLHVTGKTAEITAQIILETID